MTRHELGRNGRAGKSETAPALGRRLATGMRLGATITLLLMFAAIGALFVMLEIVSTFD